VLSWFPDLSELRFAGVAPLGSKPIASVEGATPLFGRWAPRLQQSLRDLRFLSLLTPPKKGGSKPETPAGPQRLLATQQALVMLVAEAGLSQLQRLHLTGADDGLIKRNSGNNGSHGAVDLCPLFRASPLLQHLSLRAIPLPDFSAFALLPHLHTLCEVSWPAAVTPDSSIASCFPSLTSLSVRDGPHRTGVKPHYCWTTTLVSLGSTLAKMEARELLAAAHSALTRLSIASPPLATCELPASHAAETGSSAAPAAFGHE